MKDEILNKLFPFTSMETLCFSKCTGYPYDMEGLPVVNPKLYNNNSTEKLFRVILPGNGILGEGNAEEALRIVKANLPPDIKPAVKGTAK